MHLCIYINIGLDTACGAREKEHERPTATALSPGPSAWPASGAGTADEEGLMFAKPPHVIVCDLGIAEAPRYCTTIREIASAHSERTERFEFGAAALSRGT